MCFRFSSAVSNKISSQLPTSHSVFQLFFGHYCLLLSLFFSLIKCLTGLNRLLICPRAPPVFRRRSEYFRRSRSSRRPPDLKTQIANMFDIYNPASGCLQRGGQLRLQAGHVCSGGVGGTSTRPLDSFVPYL